MVLNDRMYWPGGKTKCITFSYDDGIEQDYRLLDLFNKYKVKGTFNLNPGLFGKGGIVAGGKKEVPHIKISKEKIADTYVGHEIAAHGYEHLLMTNMDISRCVNEILKSRRELEELVQKPLTGFAYAFGAYDDNILEAVKASGIRYARTVNSTKTFDIPQNFLIWHPTCHDSEENIFELAENFLSDERSFSYYAPAKLFYIWGHSYEFDQDESWDRIEMLLKKVSLREDIWYATNEEIEAYVRAYRELIFSSNSEFVYNPSAIPVWIGGMTEDKSICIMPGQSAKVIPSED